MLQPLEFRKLNRNLMGKTYSIFSAGELEIEDASTYGNF